MKDIDGAISDFNELIRLMPNNPYAYFARGKVYQSNDEFEKAVADYNKAIELDPKYAQAFFQRSSLHETMNNFKSAIADLQKFLKLGGKQQSNSRDDVQLKILELKGKLPKRKRAK